MQLPRCMYMEPTRESTSSLPLHSFSVRLMTDRKGPRPEYLRFSFSVYSRESQIQWAASWVWGRTVRITFRDAGVLGFRVKRCCFKIYIMCNIWFLYLLHVLTAIYLEYSSSSAGTFIKIWGQPKRQTSAITWFPLFSYAGRYLCLFGHSESIIHTVFSVLFRFGSYPNHPSRPLFCSFPPPETQYITYQTSY